MARESDAKHAADLTSKGLAGFILPEGADVVWDKALPGFGLRTRGKAAREGWRWIFKYREEGSGRQIKVTLGDFLKLTPEQARKRAHQAGTIRKEKLESRASGDAARAARKADKARPDVSRLWSEYWRAEGRLKKDAKGCERLWKLHLEPFFGATKVVAVSPADVERFKVDRADTPGACNRALALLSRMMTLAVRYGYRAGSAPEHPVKGVARYPETPSEFYFSEEELGRLLEAADKDRERNLERLRELALSDAPKDRQKAALAKRWGTNPGEGLAIRMLAFTGARASEVLKAHWRQFEELPDGRLMWTVEATNTKIGRPVSRAIDADLAARLKAWGPEALALRKTVRVVPLGTPEWLFPQLADPTKPLLRIAHAWERIKEAAGVTRGRIHDLRHTAATLIVRHTKSLAQAQFQLGHATPLTTRRYAHLMREGMIETGDLLAEVASGAQAKAKEKGKAGVVSIGGGKPQGAA